MGERARGGVTFTPHWTESVSLIHLLPALCAGAVFLSDRQARGWGIARIIAVGAAGLATAVMLLHSERRRRRTKLTVCGGQILFQKDGLQKALRPERPVCVKICHAPIRGLFCAKNAKKVYLYADIARAPWVRIILPAQQADRLPQMLMNAGAGEANDIPGRTLHGRHSAAIAAMTSARTVLPLFAAGHYALLAGGNAGMMMLAGALLLLSLGNSGAAFFGCRRLSLVKRTNGFEITSGWFGGTRLFLPSDAVLGLRVRCSPAAVLVGCGRAELLCAGGRRIPCAASLSTTEMKKTAFGLLGAEGRKETVIADFDSLSRRYTSLFAAAVFCWLPALYFAWRGGGEAVKLIACTAAVVSGWAAVHCAAALKCTGDFGISITPSAVCGGGMTLSGAAFMFLRRGSVAGVRMRSTAFEEMNGLCSAGILMSGGRPAVRCQCVPDGAINGLMARFC